jgi:hypothetical protein
LAKEDAALGVGIRDRSNDTNDGNGDRENDGGRAHAIDSSKMSGLAA